MRSRFRPCLALVTAALLLPAPSFAFNTPLSDEAVREAYFLGQRHDESMAAFLSKYTKVLPAPKSGPQIYSATFLTPFALLVQHSSQQSNYSAQQAAKDHHPDDEIVVIEIQILLTPSYSALIPTRPRAPVPVLPSVTSFALPISGKISTPRCLTAKRNCLEPLLPESRPIFCDDGCVLSGAKIRLEFPTSAFTSDTASIEVALPEGEPVSVDFDLSSLR